MAPERVLKDDLLNLINELPPDKIALLLEIGTLIKFKIEHEQQPAELPTVKGGTFAELRALAGCISVGGDAVEDSEEYWK